MAPLVEYSESETETEEGVRDLQEKAVKRRRLLNISTALQDDGGGPSQNPDLPPLPPNFHDLYTSASRTSTYDDPTLHGGRTRIVPHVEGNWATHVYLEWHPTSAQYELLASIVARLDDAQSSKSPALHSLLRSDLGAQLPLHISLSRPITLVTEQRQPFVERMETSITKSSIRPFAVKFTRLDWVSNYEGTRWFLVLRLAKPAEDALNQLLHISNKLVGSFGQPVLYAEAADYTGHRSEGRARITSMRGRSGASARRAITPNRQLSSIPKERDLSEHFHVSIGWTLQRPSEEMMTRLSTINESDGVMKDIKILSVRFNSVKLKIGNTVKDVALPVKAEEGKGLIGS